MTTDRQRASNRTNAQKSTGPKTSAGRATSAQNARKHGLTAPPPLDAVTSYYRIIVDNAAATPDPDAWDERSRAALALAEAEADLARCVAFERDHLIRLYERASDGRFVGLEDLLGKVEAGKWDIDVMKALLQNRPDGELRKALQSLIRIDPERTSELHRKLKILRRYRREAESRRRKALRTWRSVSRAKSSMAELPPTGGTIGATG